MVQDILYRLVLTDAHRLRPKDDLDRWVKCMIEQLFQTKKTLRVGCCNGLNALDRHLKDKIVWYWHTYEDMKKELNNG